MNLTAEALKTFGVSLEQVACLLLVSEEKSASQIRDMLDDLYHKNLVYKYTSNKSDYLYYISNDGSSLLTNIDLYEKTKDSGLDFFGTAAQLRTIFPKGIKPGTNSRWVDGIALVAKRLKQFVVKYGEFTSDEIVAAAKKYVASFNGDYSRMRTLRYFIWAEKRNPATGEVEYTSDLLSCIEDDSEGADNNLMNDWETQLR